MYLQKCSHFFYPGIKWRMLVVLLSLLFIMFINLASLVFGFEHVVFMIEGLFGERLELWCMLFIVLELKW